ncbi:MAG: MMPL family transporter [Thermoleophilia bacterium]
MERWTRFVLHHRFIALALWAATVAVAIVGSVRLSDLLTNRFTLPGTDSQRAEQILRDRFGQRSTGGFTLVVKSDVAPAATLLPEARAAAVRATSELPTGRLVSVLPVTDTVITAQIVSELQPADAKGSTAAMREAAGSIPGAQMYLTGQAATEYDLDPVFTADLKKGELYLAIPIALVILIFTFGTLSFVVPFLVSFVTIPTTLGIIWVIANYMELTTYLTNLVTLIGFGIAIDYSLLMVYRFREELRNGQERDEAIVTMMTTAGRAVVFSGTAVAIGLALLLFMPLSFMRGFGIGGLIIPTVSVLAALTFLPVVLSLFGQRLERVRLLPSKLLDRRADHERGFWAKLARWIMRRPWLVAIGATSLLLLMAAPALALQLGPGSNEGIPQNLESVQGLNILSGAVGAGATAPTAIAIDTGKAGGASTPGVEAAVGRLRKGLEADPEVARVDFRPGDPQYVDASGRYLNVQVIGKSDYGKTASLDFVDRLRGEIIPAAALPAGVTVVAGGGPPGGKDFLDLTYSWFVWLVMAVLLATYVLLVRAFRSLLLPLKAIVLNCLSIAAAYGLMVAVFKWGWGEPFGLISYDQIEGWIPVIMFAMLFGLSMDYEVFLVSRMREEWDAGASNEEAVVVGLEKTGRLVTAAGLIMFAAFMGFVAGSIVGLQQFGFGLAAAILIDVTIVRSLLVPASMKVFGAYNWWLPEGVARIVRVPSSPLGEHRPILRPGGK